MTNKNWKLTDFQYTLFFEYHKFKFNKFLLFLPFANIYFFFNISSAWFYNLNDALLFKKIRRKLLMPLAIMAIYFFLYIILTISIDKTKVSWFIFSLFGYFFIFYIFFINPFVILFFKKSIWKIALSLNFEENKLIQLPKKEYWNNFIQNMTTNLTKINNFSLWFFQKYHESFDKNEIDPNSVDFYYKRDNRDPLDFLGSRNFTLLIGSSLYWGQIFLISNLLDSSDKIKNHKFQYVLSYFSSFITLIFLVLFISFLFLLQLEIVTFIYLILSYLLFQITMLIIKSIISRKLRKSIMVGCKKY